MFNIFKIIFLVLIFLPFSVKGQEDNNSAKTTHEGFKIVHFNLDNEKLNKHIRDYIAEIRGNEEFYVDSNLHTLAKFQSTYMAATNELTHNDSIYSTSNHRRVYYFKNLFINSDINSHNIAYRIKKNDNDKLNIDYEKLSHDIVDNFRDSPAHWKILANKRFKSFYASVSFKLLNEYYDSYSFSMYTCLVFTICKPNEVFDYETTRQKEFKNHINNMIEKNRITEIN